MPRGRRSVPRHRARLKGRRTCTDRQGANGSARQLPVPARGSVITSDDILELLGRFGGRFNWVHVEKLRMFDGEPSFSRAQGEI